MEKPGLTALPPTERTPFLEEEHSSRVADFLRRHLKIVIPAGIMILLLPLLGLIALKDRGAKADYVSPIVYPSPQGYGAGNWSEAYDKAKTMVGKMTLEEKNNLTIGYDVEKANTGCVGLSGSAPRVGFPGFCLHDAGNGVRNADGVSGFASGIHIGATWNATLAYERAVFMGAEFKKKGVNVALGPVVGPIGRIAEGGRNFEGFAADAYMNGILGAQSVRGLQENVIASIKHWVANEQETNRNPIQHDDGTTLSSSSNVDDRTMHETYIWPFQDTLYAGVGSVMCSYNRINGTYACENSLAMNSILKGELDFQGFVVSDWKAQHSARESANAGLDMAMPTSPFWDKDQLADMVKNNALNETRLTDMATRIVATWYQFGQDDPAFPPTGVGMALDLLKPHAFIDARDPKSKGSLLQQALEGHVLVKNANGTLPLGKLNILSVFGYDAIVQSSFNPTQATFGVNRENIGLNSTGQNELDNNRPLSNAPQKAMGTLTSGGGSGCNTPAYLNSPYDALQARAYQDDTSIFYDFESFSPGVVSGSDACLVFINEYASEAWDRPGLADPESDDLVKSVASQCNNTIVVIHNAGIRLVDEWIDNKNVTAVVFAHLPGQDAGRSVVQLLYGDVSPSGRLPYTVAKKSSDYGDLQGPCIDSSDDPQCDYSEGVNIDYRSFLARDVTPRYAFGFGLTYSTFDYSDLTINMNATSTANAPSTAPVYVNGTTNQNIDRTDVGIGGLQSLFQGVGTISASIKNSGKVAASEVAQLYLQIPVPKADTGSNTNTRVLRGFQKVAIDPGESATVSFSLRRKDISYWNIANQTWTTPDGEYGVYVGKSVLDTPLVGSFPLA